MHCYWTVSVGKRARAIYTAVASQLPEPKALPLDLRLSPQSPRAALMPWPAVVCRKACHGTESRRIIFLRPTHTPHTQLWMLFEME